MEAFFTSLSRAIEAAPPAALGASLLWGIASIVLSPCHLTSIPLIVGFINGGGRISTGRAFQISLSFSVGILLTVAAMGAVTAATGRIMGDVGRAGNIVVALILLALGFHLLGLIPFPWNGPGQVRTNRRGALAAFFLGLVFGIALGPCTFAFLAPMLAVSFRLASSNLLHGIVLLLFYGIGHCSVIVLAGTSTEVVQRYLHWTEQSRGAVLLRKLCGTLVLLGGIYLITRA